MGGAGGRGRAARALRLLLLLVMALAAVEYLCGSIFEASPLRTYLHNAAWPTQIFRNMSSSSQPPRLHRKINPDNITERIFSLTKNNNISVTEGKIQETTTSSVTSKIADVTVKGLSSLDLLDVPGNTALPDCNLPSNLGPVAVNKTEIALSSIENKFPQVEVGGWYRPPNCTAKHKVAIIIPFRDREQHLAIFLNHMHPFLMKQQLDYGIFVIEQKGRNSFNRAKLFNVGFVESNRLRAGGWQCFVFHDVDLLPLDERNIYSCPRQPRHMSASLDKHNFTLLYSDLFGGVSALTYEHFTKVNGFSNKYWGWGGEDDDMSRRVQKLYKIERYNMTIARYTMLDHNQQTPNPERFNLLKNNVNYTAIDGLSSLKYTLNKIKKQRLFTLISVNLDEKDKTTQTTRNKQKRIGNSRLSHHRPIPYI